MTPKKTLKKWFSNFMKPAQEHFAEWIDSYWHKNEKIPMKNIDGLSTAIENTVSAKQLLNHLDDTNAHHALFEELKRQIQALQTVLEVDDVNFDTLQKIVTELKANTKLQELIDKKVNKEDGKGLSTNDFTNEHKQKLEGLQPTDVSGLLPKGGYDGTGQELKDAIDGLQTKMQQVETTLSVDDTDFDTLQEIATQVKSNNNLEQLLTGKIDKEEYFEKLKELIQLNMGNIHLKSKDNIALFAEMLFLNAGNIMVNSLRTINVSCDSGIYISGKENSTPTEVFSVVSRGFNVTAENIHLKSNSTVLLSENIIIVDDTEINLGNPKRILLGGKDITNNLKNTPNTEDIERRIRAIENTLMNAGFTIQEQP